MTILGWLALAVGIGLTLAWLGDAVAVMLAADETDRMLGRAMRGDVERMTQPSQRTPVSIVIAARDNCGSIIHCIEAALHQQYTEVEVIVVDDGSTVGTLERLVAAFDLREHDTPVRRVYPTRGIGAMYESAAASNLRVVTKPRGSRADALNCGLNLAHHRYVCTALANMVLAPNAIADAMRLARTDPRQIVGIVMPLVADTVETRTGTRADSGWLSQALRLQQLSGFVLETVAASRVNAVFCQSGTLTMWRSDVLEQLGGFSSRFLDPIAEFSFRVQEHMRARQVPFRVVAMPWAQGRIVTRSGWTAFVRERADRVRSLLELLRRYRTMVLNRRCDAVALFAIPQLIAREALRPVLVAAGSVIAGVALLGGAITLLDLVVGLAAVAFASGLLTTAALLIHDRAQRALPFRDLVRLTLRAPLQPFTLGPALASARAVAAWRTVAPEPKYRSRIP